MSIDIKRARLRDETTLWLGGLGDNWHMSWAADDTQLVALCDGAGWPGLKRRGYNCRLYRIIGDPEDAKFADIPEYPDLIDIPSDKSGRARYYGYGTFAVDGHIFQYMSTFNNPLSPTGEPPAGLRFVGAKLIYSPDDGVTWFNQNGSTPVAWESFAARSRETMVFFEEEQETFSQLSVLQMGRNYDANTDGYVYVYGSNGNTEGTMNELVMFRVRRERILDRGSYEYLAERRRDGTAIWSTEIGDRSVVHTFPSGWVNTTVHPYAWQPSIVFNPGLGLYMMSNWGTGCTPEGKWFGKPSYLGLWTAERPWGPWVQIHEDTAWTPVGDSAARAYQPQIAPKWIAADGKSFWLVWSDFQRSDDSEADRRHREELKQVAKSATVPDEKTLDDLFTAWSKNFPRYAFNTQRVDLIA